MERYVVPPPPGSLVWEHDPDPFGDPATKTRLRGGTLVGWDRASGRVRVITGTPLGRGSAGRQAHEVRHAELPLDIFDPASTVLADSRGYDRSSLARRIFRAVADRSGRVGPLDHDLVAWATLIWASTPHWSCLEPDEYREGLVVPGGEVVEAVEAVEASPSRPGAWTCLNCNDEPCTCSDYH